MSYVRTPAIRAKQRRTMLRRKAAGLQPKGWKHSPEARARMSASQKRRTVHPFTGRRHSEESKNKMGFFRTGIKRNKKERLQHRRYYQRMYLVNHPEKVADYDKKYLKYRSLNNRRRRAALRQTVITSLGGTQERKRLHCETFLKHVLAHLAEYQLLCANCNWTKAYEHKEFNWLYEVSPR
jgi:NUMOD3 motif